MKPPLLIIDAKKREVFGDKTKTPSNEKNDSVTMTRRTWKLKVSFNKKAQWQNAWIY